MTAAAAPALARHYRGVLPLLAAGLVLVVLASARWGAVAIAPAEMASALRHSWEAPGALTLDERIFLEIRLPRALLTALVGASLAVGGVLMQALFRNPIVEPGLVGTSSGAAFGAALYFVLGASFRVHAGAWTLPAAACAGGLLATWLVFTLSRTGAAGRGSVVALLLTGIAINALFMSGVGFLSYMARDPQARSITFWNLGTLAGASWRAVAVVGAATALGVAVGLRHARQLNALMLGEEEARYLGVDVRRLRAVVLGANVVMVAVATAFTGVIAFVGLVVPHLLRMLRGADNRFLMLGGMLAGGILLGLADLAARLLLAPAELPIGVVTSLVGVPAFVALLRQRRAFF
ncbi:iron ABC transporter permease [Roseisolibacter sp. H3M3-2]|uniref:FecCD family ABC transporter permease n=1 Tax=Roseisolibacter sp. H3M3-2 TaxID=3031323 RepID=UPI0023DB6078|nr:iron ABC transporter permease [Roseisolibacter sp. H3M3-2]MDF1501407.1 iron ABC transporter permease [Roseisolibacter sp. H3M3-2]